MLGVIVNVGTVLLGSLVGLFLKRGIPEKVTEALMIGIGLCTVFIGTGWPLMWKPGLSRRTVRLRWPRAL